MAPINQTLNQGIPQMSFPFVLPNGTITQPWFQLLIALWKRTGGGTTGGFVTEIDTGQGLQGGPINGLNPTGTIKLADADTLTLLANVLPVAAIPTDVSFNAFLDAVFGDAPGQLIFRDTFSWTTLAIGAENQALEVVSGLPAWHDTQPGLLPMVNGDLPGPSLISTPSGECVGVPV